MAALDDEAVHIWLERPPTPLDWAPILDRLEDFADAAHAVVLAGPGWTTPYCWKIARTLSELLPKQGIRVDVESPTLERFAVVGGSPGRRDE